ncbi:hypothetical protein HYS79_02250 [Patescibacteria group bacterium]|nr:hypothetical protein [Patescibacteria group bacterium]
MKTRSSSSPAESNPNEWAHIGFLIVGGLVMVAYVWLELFGGRLLAVAIGDWTFVAPQAALLLILCLCLFRRKSPPGEFDALFYGALYLGAVAVKLHPVEDTNMVIDAAIGIWILIMGIAFLPRPRRAVS